jgi:hypothetical protein
VARSARSHTGRVLAEAFGRRVIPLDRRAAG